MRVILVFWYFVLIFLGITPACAGNTVAAGVQMVSVNSLRRNELRNWVALPPDAEMDDLLVLENYIQAHDVQNQMKLVQNQGKGGENNEQS